MVKKSKLIDCQEKLESYLSNPGRFSILITGKQGTGKTYSVQTIQKKLSRVSVTSCKGIKSVYAGIVEASYENWQHILNEAKNKILLIEEVDKLGSRSQDILFDIISTTDGNYGYEKKDVKCRLVFTSTLSINQLRDDRRYLSSKFFDRISQFVLEMPEFKDDETFIQLYFKATWRKMKFKTTNDPPEFKGEIRSWFETIVVKMNGNFRDLDKIVINWHNYRLMHMEHNEILPLIKADFENRLRNPLQIEYSDNIFEFKEDIPFNEMLDDFRFKLYRWAIKVYGNKKIAQERLGKSMRTLERYGNPS